MNETDVIAHAKRGHDKYGRHDAWNVPCNGFWLVDFDFSADPHEHKGRHRLGKRERGSVGQPCGGMICNGDPWCGICQEEIAILHAEQWRNYYADLRPLDGPY